MGKIPKAWDKNIDARGLITQSDPSQDGGDTMQRVGMVKLGSTILRSLNIPTQWYPYFDDEDWHKALNWLEHERYKGLWRRHGDWSKWFGRFKTHGTRDQLRPMIAALGATRSTKRLWHTFFRHLTRRALLFAEGNRKNHQYADREEMTIKNPNGTWNGDKWRFPDPTGPQIWASYIRGFLNCLGKDFISMLDNCFVWLMMFDILKMTDFFPDHLHWMIFLSPLVILSILDLQTLGSSILITFKKANRSTYVGDMNHLCDLSWAVFCYPTFTIQLARFIYLFRPLAAVPKSGSLWDKKFGPQTALDYYFRPENYGPPMNHLWKHVVDWLYPADSVWGILRKKVEKAR